MRYNVADACAVTARPFYWEQKINLESKKKMTMLGTLRKSTVLGFLAAAFLTFAVTAQANNLVANGGFETTTNGANYQFESSHSNHPYTTATGWTSTNSHHNASNFIFSSGRADSTGATGQSGNLKLWGPGTGSNNGLPASSPDGGNYVAADGAYQNGAISQTINGLTVGDSYTVSFWWAGAQQSGFTGATTEQWKVSFGSQTQSTAVVHNASHGFTGWMQDSFTFKADKTSDLLSFFAVGTPNGVPPFVLLDGVDLEANKTPTPEPGTLALLGSGLLGGLGVLRSKKWFNR